MNQESGQTKRLLMGLIVGAIFGLGIGLLVGLTFAYRIAPLEWTDGGPQDLREDFAAYYWEMVAESYGQHGDLELAKRQLGDWDDENQLQTVLERARIESSPERQMILDSLAEKVTGAQAVPAVPPAAGEEPAPEAKPEKGGPSLLTIFGVLLVIVLVLVVVALLVTRMRKRKATTSTMETVEEEPEWLSTMRATESVSALPPLGHFVTSYAMGNDNYDESFSIETSTGEFLGECGVGISETIGVGDPDKVTAFEVWLFDKNDIRTVTKVMMSEYAYNDQELRASLAPKGEAVLIQNNEPLTLETATLQIEAMVTEANYGSGALPPNSHFERLTVELVARQKEATETIVSSDEEFEL